MSRSKKQRRLQVQRRIVTQIESLESRDLLAADVVSPHQNPVMHNDVNGDSHVTGLDLLYLLTDLRENGPRMLSDVASAEPGSESGSRPMFDTNGDMAVSSIDALRVLQELNGGSGEGELFRVRPEITDTDGNVVSTVTVGDDFTLNVYVQDLRGADAAGVFSIYNDVTYDDSLVSIPSGNTLSYGSQFGDGQSGNVDVPGLIDEAGALDQSIPTEEEESLELLVYSIDMTADAVGTATFATDPADILPIHEFLEWGSLADITNDEIDYASVELTIEDPATTPDLVAFAQVLDTSGVTFWSTRQANPDAVSQRALFEDGANFLPFRESLDANGNLTAEAEAAGITSVNTWVFSDSSTATGVLSLEDIATFSGITIPLDSTPTLLPVVESNSVTIQENSPLHLPLDAYDPENGVLTYTVSVDDPSLVEPVIIGGNRSWVLDIDGYGQMVFELFEGRVPRATDQFIELTEGDFFDGTVFHRVDDGVQIQGGSQNGDGLGGSGLADFDDQFNVDLQHNRQGVLSAVKVGDDDTNNSQFFITDGPNSRLDFAFTNFGQLVEGFDVLDAVSSTAVNGTRPVQDVVISEANIIDDMENGVLMLRALGSSGTTNVTVTVTDNQGKTATDTFEVNLAAGDNKRPFLEDVPAPIGRAGQDTEFQLNHIDIEDDPVVFGATVVGDTGATAEVSDTGLVTVSVPEGINAGELITVNVSVRQDGSTAIDRQQVDVTVVEDLTAVDDTIPIDEDSTSVDLPVLLNDSRGSLINARITSVTQPTEGGTLEISSGGQRLFYTPPADFPIGSTDPQAITFTYTVTDSLLNETSTANVTLNVTPVNDPPVAADDAFPADFELPQDLDSLRALIEDNTTEIFFSVTGNDSVLPDADTASITDVSSDTGTVRIVDGTIGYIPGNDVFGDDSFTYTFTDEGGLSDTATVTVSIAQVNDSPIGGDDVVDAAAGNAVTIQASDLLANDSAGPREDTVQSLTITAVSQPANGSAVLNSDGTITLTMNDGFEGSDTFTYTIEDDGVTESFDDINNEFTPSAEPLTTTVSVTINSTAVARDDEYTVPPSVTEPIGTSLDVRVNDEDGVNLTITSVSTPTNGTAEVINNGEDILYTPTVGFDGSDTFTYTVEDSSGVSSTANVSVTVRAEIPPPIADDDAITISANTTDQTLDVLQNDSPSRPPDNAGDIVLSISSIIDETDNGTVSISADGSVLVYTPNQDFVGTDSLVYEVVDARGGSDLASVTITVEASNTDPTAVDDNLIFARSGQTELNVLANDTTDDAGETLTIVEIVSPATSGIATIAADSLSITYEPINDSVAADTLTYRISDGNGGSAIATVNLSVEVVNQAPVAVDDTSAGLQDTDQVIDVLSNDTTEAGETLTLEAIVTQPTNGSAVIENGSIRYTPDAGFVGSDSLTYRINDGNGATATGTVSIAVNAEQNEAPIANDDTSTGLQDADQVINVLSNDTTEAGETLTLEAIVTQPTNGSAVIENGSIRYTPDAGFVGSDSLTYRINDGNGATATGTVSIAVNAEQNEAPIANDDTSTGLQDADQVINVLSNDTTEAGETLTLEAIVTQPTNGSAVIENGSIRYTPDAGFVGSDSLTYRINDGNGATATGTVSITVTAPVGGDPIAEDDSFEITSFSRTVLDVLANDGHEDGDPISIVSVTPGRGSVSISSDGSTIEYIATGGSSDTDSFTYTIEDADGETATATVTLTIPVVETSFVAGSVYHDRDNDGQQDITETGVGGVVLTLEGTDESGNSVREQTTTDIRGRYRFQGILPGSYTISQEQPAFTAGGTNSFGFNFTEEDQFDIQVADVVASDDNQYAERGLVGQLAVIEALSSWRGDGALILLDGDNLSWIEDQGGWGSVDSLTVARDGDNLEIQTADGTVTLSMNDPSLVKLVGSENNYTLIRLNGSSQDVLSAASVDAAFAV